MRRNILVSLFVLIAFSPALFAQQTTPADTTKPPPTVVQSDSAQAAARAKQEADHRRKILLWTLGIVLFIGLNLVLSDRQPGQ